jgi:hypothetical protein
MNKFLVIIDTTYDRRLEFEHDNFRDAIAKADAWLASTSFRAIRLFDSVGHIIAQAYEGDAQFR